MLFSSLLFGAKFHQNAKEQCGAATKAFFWEIFENHSPKFRVFGLGFTRFRVPAPAGGQTADGLQTFF